MAKKKKEWSPFVETEGGKKLVDASSIMHPLCLLADGLSFSVFPGDSSYYLEIDVAIDWCKKEMEHHDREKYEIIVAVLEKFKAQPTPSEVQS